MKKNFLSALLIKVIVLNFFCLGFIPYKALAQPDNVTAPLPGANPYSVQSRKYSAQQTSAGTSLPNSYQLLPLNVIDAQERLEDLKNALSEYSPQNKQAKDLQDNILQLCDWLSDMTDAHFQLANSLSKNDATKAQADSEKELAHKFVGLRNQARLLKADLLIKEHRLPEALAPLVQIVVAEPKSTTGQAAYKRLAELGFSEDIGMKTIPTTSITPIKVTTPTTKKTDTATSNKKLSEAHHAKSK